ncbi:MAG: glycosyltransferase [Phycisphaerae bacterium]|nr:glycosyltransferase [Gemmatimonadaceae bacterium]
MAAAEVTVVIPSTAIPERFDLLLRAIRSVREQRGVRAIPLVVLNGTQYTADAERALRAEQDVRVVVQEDRNLPAALRRGREEVHTPWFTALDDDDLLLPDALATRLSVLQGNSELDIVVTNGIIRHKGRDTLHVPASLNITASPLRALVHHNWFLPGCWLARTDRVLPELFDGMPRYRECTFLALRMASQYRLRWIDAPTVVRFVDSPQAESQSRHYVMGQVDALRALAALELPDYLQKSLRLRITAAMHESADLLWREGKLDQAWRMHWDSLRAYRGLRYLSFTRHLLLASLLGRTQSKAERSLA